MLDPVPEMAAAAFQRDEHKETLSNLAQSVPVSWRDPVDVGRNPHSASGWVWHCCSPTFAVITWSIVHKNVSKESEQSQKKFLQ